IFLFVFFFFFFQAEDGIRDHCVTGVQTCALPIFHGGTVLKEPIVEMIFLGDWTAPSQAARKAALLRRVGQISTSDSFQATSAYGVRAAGLLLSSRDVAASGTLNNLRIQAKIDAGLADGSLPLRDENVIHLSLLAPGLQSVLGSSAGGRH